MRLWTVNPEYLDSQGLVALWREALLAKAVLSGKTRGYRNHPQLIRFRETGNPIAYINRYLETIYDESCARGFCFDGRKFRRVDKLEPILETDGQLMHEWKHLKRKLKSRSPEKYKQIRGIIAPKPNPLFRIEHGNKRDWEKFDL